MKLKNLVAVLVLSVALTPAAFAQLERVVAEARKGDIDCLACAPVIEMGLKSVPGVDKVGVSVSQERVAITFTDGARFLPDQYREAILRAEVRVDRFHVAMRGRVEVDGDARYFVFGSERFLITDAPEDLPVRTVIGVMAQIDDASKPYRASVSDFKLQP